MPPSPARVFFPVISCLHHLQAVFWVETKGKTLEEIDAIFEGEKHSSVPDVERVIQGEARLDVGMVEQQISADLEAAKKEE